MLPHSCSGIGSSSGGGVFELHNFKPKNSCLLGISKLFSNCILICVDVGSWINPQENTLLSVYHYAFAQQFLTQVLPHLDEQDKVKVTTYVEVVKKLYPSVK
jgi:hypothetical protein